MNEEMQIQKNLAIARAMVMPKEELRQNVFSLYKEYQLPSDGSPGGALREPLLLIIGRLPQDLLLRFVYYVLRLAEEPENKILQSDAEILCAVAHDEDYFPAVGAPFAGGLINIGAILMKALTCEKHLVIMYQALYLAQEEWRDA